MQFEKITIYVAGIDPYDHSRYTLETTGGDVRLDDFAWRSYQQHVEKIRETKSKSFYHIYVVDLNAGTNELVLSVVNPEKQRMELNVKAKPAFGASKKLKKSALEILAEGSLLNSIPLSTYMLTHYLTLV